MSTPLAQSADSALLAILLERMKTSEAQKTLNQIGVAKFLGSVIFRADGGLAESTSG